MKRAFLYEGKLQAKNKELLDMIESIINQYLDQGYTMTLRQLYYQLVSRDVIRNKTSEYNKLSRLLKFGRMRGLVDWEAIEDRIRVPYLPYYCLGVADAIRDTISQYRRDRQERQNNYVELWVEKDALSGILKRVTQHYHIRLMVNRGYSSCTAMYDAYNRLKAQERAGKTCYILYLGDHDPSGLDMIRDIRDRLLEFGAEVTVKHIGLTTEQVKKYNPPPNPAKFSDPRAEWYISQHGAVSWEVDALPPDVLDRLVRDEIERLIDMNTFHEVLEQEEADRAELSKLAEGYQEY